MATLSDKIENYIKELLYKSSDKQVRIKRSQLAEKFMCVPSQINYVLSTRFSIEQGYLVESRRGGGGYLEITKLPLSSDKELVRLIEETPKMVSQKMAEGILKRLKEEGILTERENLLLNAVIQRDTINLDLPDRDIIRANILKAVLQTILKEEFTH